MGMLVLAGKSIKQIIRDWKTVTFLLVMPVVFTLFLGLIFTNDSVVETIDEKSFMENFSSQSGPGEENRDMSVVVGEVYLEVLEERGYTFDEGLSKEEIQRAAELLAGRQLNNVEAGMEEYQLQSGSDDDTVFQAASGFEQSSPGMIIQFTIMGLITSAMVFLIERKSKTLSRLMITPVSYPGIIGGQLIAMFCVVLVQQMVLVFIGALFFQVSYFQNAAALMSLLIMFAVWATAFGVMISTIATNEDQVVTICIISMFIFSIFGGAWFPLEITGDTFIKIAHILPTAWVMDGFHDIILRGKGMSALVPVFLVLAGYSALFFFISLFRFRKIKVTA